MDDKTKIIRFLIRKSFHVRGVYEIDLYVEYTYTWGKMFNKFVDYYVEFTHFIDIKVDIVFRFESI